MQNIWYLNLVELEKWHGRKRYGGIFSAPQYLSTEPFFDILPKGSNSEKSNKKIPFIDIFQRDDIRGLKSSVVNKKSGKIVWKIDIF